MRSARELVMAAALNGRAQDDGIIVLLDPGNQTFIVLRQTDSALAGCSRLDFRGARALVNCFRASTEPADLIVQAFLRAMETPIAEFPPPLVMS